MIKKTLSISAKNMLLFFFCLFLSFTSFAQNVEPEWVLLDDIKWATRNVDAPGTFAARPEDAGMLYQWNSKIGWSTTEPMISSDADATWNNSKDIGYTWEKDNDPCPPGWRIPIHAEYLKLFSAATNWTTINDVNGYLFGSDDNLLFLPAAGERFANGRMTGIDRRGEYWIIRTTDGIDSFGFENLGLSFGMSTRQGAHTVRCVVE